MKTGLVLEGGSLRTIFSSGVCDGFLEAGIDFEYIIGVSAGIAYGVSYLSRQKGRNLEVLTRYANDRRYMGKRNLFKPGNRSYFGLEFSYNTIPETLVPFDYETFSAYRGQAEAVVTNLNTGQAEYFPVPPGRDEQNLLRATCAMPLLFPIHYICGAPYLDGGAADAIPYERAFAQGCDRVVVVLTREREYLRKAESLQPLINLRYRRYPKFCETMANRAETYNQSRARLFALERMGKALLIAPQDTAGFSRTERDVEKIRALWQAGYDQSLARAGEIRAFCADTRQE